MPIDALAGGAIDRLVDARVANVTLTGGEPFVHPGLTEIVRLLVNSRIDVTICTNGVSITQRHIDEFKALGRVRVNVSLDGFSADSHGKFRGDPASFDVTVSNARLLADAGLLKGILSTPNGLAEPDEYRQLYAFTSELSGEYLLMNPLSRFGRGVWTQRRLATDETVMETIRSGIAMAQTPSGPEAVFIRFPNGDRPLTGCIAGEIFYVFVNGDATICPYLDFAARTPGSQHSPEEFIFGNLFRDPDFARRLDQDDFHNRYQAGGNPTCRSCSINTSCGKGCPAAVITAGGRLGDLDADVCPVASRSR